MVSFLFCLFTILPFCFILGFSPLLRATNVDSNIDLELRLAPPLTNESSKESTYLASHTAEPQTGLQTQSRTLDPGAKRKRGRPRLNLTEEERIERRKKQNKASNQV